MKSLNSILNQAGNYKNNSVDTRLAAIEELRFYPCEEVVKRLTKISIVDPDLNVRRKAVSAIQSINPSFAYQIYMDHLTHPNPNVLINAIHSIKQLGLKPSATIKALSRFLNHPDTRVRQTATSTVQKLADGQPAAGWRPTNGWSRGSGGPSRSNGSAPPKIFGRSSAVY